MKKELAKGIKLISCSGLDCASMQSITGGIRPPVEGGACCYCMPNQGSTGIGATEKARH